MYESWDIIENNLFKTVDSADLKYLKSVSKPFKYSKNEVVFLQGDRSNSIFFLNIGRVKISKINLDGRKLTFDIIEPGEFFGELSMSKELERRTIAEAVVESSGYEMRSSDFEVFLQKRPDIAIRLIQMIGDKRLALEKLLEDMIFMDVQSRVVSLFLRYSDIDTLKIPLTHQEIADMTGATRVSVSRTIAKLRKDGLIETQGERIKLINKQTLQNILNIER
ncbi:transcriptional regulator, Crp/Fnr family [Candidatus Magnetoovum chiemensis]|nr:transcriptional regulator, Crp/Fnr family [Candidatus Magnetoovum chiemensis]